MDKNIIKDYLGDDTKNPVNKIINLLKEDSGFKKNEIGLYHPRTKAFIKLKDKNGIDLFAKLNGIKINGDENSITIITHNEKHYVNNLNMDISGNISYNIKRGYSINCDDKLINIGSLNISELIEENKNMKNNIEILLQRCNELREEIEILKSGE